METNAMFKPVEDRDMVWKLESIGGEILSLTPTIVGIHRTHGRITLEFLDGAEKAAEIRKAVAEKDEKAVTEIAEMALEAKA